MKRSFMRSRNDAKLCLAAGRIFGVRRIPQSGSDGWLLMTPHTSRMLSLKAVSASFGTDSQQSKAAMSELPNWVICPPKFLLPTAFLFALTGCGDSGAPAETRAPETDPVAESEQQLLERARGIHERVITLDTHVDISTSNFTAENNYTSDLDTQVNLPKIESGGLDVAWFIVYTGQGPLNDEGYAAAYANAIDKFDAIHRLSEEIAPDRIGLALTSDDVRDIAAGGRKVAMIGIENAYPVGLDLSRIAEFHARGGRYMSLAHNGHSQFADSNTGEANDDYLHGGLSELGRQALAEMNRLGIMVDISHPSADAISQMLDVTTAPVVASHSSARALTDHSRNLSDELLMRVRDNGGVVQTVALDVYINEARRVYITEGRQRLTEEIAAEMEVELLTDEQVEELEAGARSEYEAALSSVQEQLRARFGAEVGSQAPPATVADLVDHIDYMVDLIGIEHVGISSDFDGGGGIEGWNDASETFNVTLELVRRGYTGEEIGMLWSGNLLRVLDQVQQIAAQGA